MEIKPSLSVIIPAFNEEGNLEATVNTVRKAIDGKFSDYEMLIFNDFSADKTGIIADSIAVKDKHVKVIHNSQNMGFGYNYNKGVEIASKDFVAMVPGDNEIPGESLQKIFEGIGKADIVIPYVANSAIRPLSRRIISWTFQTMLNIIFGLNLSYYNGPCVHRSSLVKAIPKNTKGFAYMASILIRLLKSGVTYIEVPMVIKPREHGKTKAFAPRNIISVTKAILLLFWEVILKKNKYRERACKIEHITYYSSLPSDEAEEEI